MKRIVSLIALLFCLVVPALAVSPDEVLGDPALEQRARDISAGLRCLVCQNQSIDDSDADLARDLRILVRERLVAGDSNAEVEQYLVDRYGEYVLLNPRLNNHTLILCCWHSVSSASSGLFGAHLPKPMKSACPTMKSAFWPNFPALEKTRRERAEGDLLAPWWRDMPLS
jgi:cytochrome c-type biogenesis protein CcmH/NrfF